MRFPNLKGTQVLAHGPKTSAVARLEASGRHKKHSPSIATLKNMQRLLSGHSADTSLDKRAVLEVFLTKHGDYLY